VFNASIKTPTQSDQPTYSTKTSWEHGTGALSCPNPSRAATLLMNDTAAHLNRFRG